MEQETASAFVAAVGFLLAAGIVAAAAAEASLWWVILSFSALAVPLGITGILLFAVAAGFLADDRRRRDRRRP